MLHLDAKSFSFDINIENPFSLIYEESEEEPLSSRVHTGSNVCGITDINGASMPWGRRRFEENPEYVCIGCSCTVSMGLIEEYSWPSLIRSLTGLKVNNLSAPAAGTDFVCSLAIDSFAKYGKPKKLLALFPDIYRLWTLSPSSNSCDGMTHTVHASWHTDVDEYFLDVRHSFISGLDRPDTASPMLFKNYLGEYSTFPPDLTIFNSLSTLEILIKFCNINDIEFKFSSWENDANSIFASLDYYKDNYVDVVIAKDLSAARKNGELINSETPDDEIWWDDDVNLRKTYLAPWRRIGKSKTCNHYPQTEYQKKWWSVANDVGQHPGIHDQIHFAEHLSGLDISNEFLRTLI
jgi:hypothetical protein